MKILLDKQGKMKAYEGTPEELSAFLNSMIVKEIALTAQMQMIANASRKGIEKNQMNKEENKEGEKK